MSKSPKTKTMWWGGRAGLVEEFYRSAFHISNNMREATRRAAEEPKGPPPGSAKALTFRKE